MLSRRAAGRVLFLAAAAALPLPWYLGEMESAPLARLAFFTSLVGSVLAVEGGRTTALIFALGLAQTVAWGAALRLVAALVARALAGLRSPAWRTTIVAALAIGMIGAALLPIYRTPLSSQRARSSLLGIFD